MSSGELVGRSELLAQVSSVLEAPSPRVLLVGEPGIGKTAVWTATLSSRAAAWTWSTQCLEVEADLGLGVLADCFRAAPEEVIAELPAPQRRAVDLVLFRDDDPDGANADARLLGATALGVLNALARRGEVLIAVDDLHWCDPPSLAALTFALRRAIDGVTAFATSRTRQAPNLPGWHAIEVPSLSQAAVRELARSLGHRAAIERFDERVEEIVRISDGNPLFAKTLTMHAVHEPTDGRLPTSLLRAVERRVDTLDANFWSALVEIAVRGASAAADLDDDVRAAVRASDLLVIDRGRVAFAHPLFSTAVREAASPEQLRVAHRRAAVHATDPVARTLHLLQADADDPRLDVDLDPAARLAWSRGDIDGACRLTRLAAARPSTDAVQVERLTRLAELERISGDAVRSAETARRLGALARTPHDRAIALEKLAHVTDDDEAAIGLLKQAAVSPGLSVAQQDGLRSSIANRLFRAGLIADAAAAVGDVDAEAQPSAAAFAQLLARVSGRPADLAVLGRALVAERKQLEVTGGGEAPAHAMAGMLAVYEDRHADAADLLERAAAFEADRGRHSIGSYFLGLLDIRTGRLDHAVAVLGAASAVDGPNALGHARMALAHAWRADADAMHDALHRARGLITSDTDRACSEVLFSEGLDLLFRGRYADALSTLGRAADRLDRIGFREPSHPAVLPAAIEAAVAMGDRESAEGWWRRLGRDSAGTGSRFGSAAAIAARGHLARGAEDHPAAERHYLAAISAFDGLGHPLEAARLELALGAMLRRIGERRRARAFLQKAVTTFESCGARGLCSVARAELNSVSGRRAGDSAELTATEQRVAELVAEGLTNAEVAQTLHVSPKTVETHLGHAYRKLGVHNRTELSRRLR